MDGLLSFVVFAAGFYLMMRFGCGGHMRRNRGQHAHREQPSLETTTTDRVSNAAGSGGHTTRTAA